MDTTGDWVRPATAFLSYKREDTEEVKMLQRQLHARGMHAWRDVTHLPVGAYSKDEISHAIAQECDAFLLYMTPQCLASDFIWDVEVPTAFRRWERDHSFGIVPVLRGVSIAQLRQFCVDHGIPDLAEFNGIVLPELCDGMNEQVNIKIRDVAERMLTATLRLRLRRVGADHHTYRTYEPSLCLRTAHYAPPINSLDLDVNWLEFFIEGRNERWPAEQEWQETLLPALYDVKNVLGMVPHSRTLHMAVHAQLPAAFALGFVFSLTARLKLVLENERFTWRSDEPLTNNEAPLTQRIFDGGGDKHIAVVEVSISRSITASVSANLPSLSIVPGYRVQFEVKGGARIDSVKDAAQALAIARQVGQELRYLYDLKGVTQMHLFLSSPAEMAVLLGHQLNATGTITVYQYVRGQGVYVPGCVLRH